MAATWVARREYHPDAPRLGQLVDDTSRFGATEPPRRGDVATHQLTAVTGPWSDADRLWDRFLTGGVRHPAFRVVRDGVTMPRSTYCRRAPVGHQQIDDLAEPNRVLELHAGGATLVLQALQFGDPEYARLSTNLALEVDHPVQVNAYLSPANARGLDIHFDFHDVVVVQLAGAKRWRVWAPLQRTERPVKRGPTIAQPSVEELSRPVVDRTVEPGDCIAIPRGFPHAAETVDEASTHLTIGIMALTWDRVLRDRIDDVATGTPLADRLPFGALAAQRPCTAAAAITALTAHLDDTALRHAVAAEVWSRQPQTRLRPLGLGGAHDSRSAGASALHVHDPMRVTPGPLLWLDGRDTPDHKQSLQLGDRRLRFPSEGYDFVAGVLDAAGSFTAASVAAKLDDDSRLVVMRRLVAEGVVARA